MTKHTSEIAEFIKRGQQAQTAVDEIISRAKIRPDKKTAKQRTAHKDVR